MSFIYAFLVICVAALSFASFYFWQQARSTAAILREGARRFNELAQHRKVIATEAEAIRATLRKSEVELEVAENQLASLRRKISEQDVIIEKHYGAVSSYNNQIEHLKIQVETLTEQIKERERKTHQPAVPQVQKQVLNQLEEKYRKTSADYQSAVQKISQMEKQYGQVNTEELRAYKKRCAQFNRMYHGMRSLKEMAEQKSDNFETALLHLSQWVLTQTKGEKISSGKFGEVVGEALERTGGSFVDAATAAASEEAGHAAQEA